MYCRLGDSTQDPGEGPKTGILKSIVFHKIPTVEFDFVAISVGVAKAYVTVCDGERQLSKMPATSGRGVGANFYP